MTHICLDSEIVLGFLIGDEKATKKLQFYLYEDLSMSAISLVELRCAVNDQDAINSFISQIRVLPITEKVATITAHLISEHPSLSLPDALVGASCLAYHAYLLTLRRKAFEHIKGLSFL